MKMHYEVYKLFRRKIDNSEKMGRGVNKLFYFDNKWYNIILGRLKVTYCNFQSNNNIKGDRAKE